MDGTDRTLTRDIVLRWFPLVPRPRPPALPLVDRIRELTNLATQPPAGDDHQQASRAAEICNKAALIASDLALPDLARSLCWRQFEIYDRARPLPGWAAELALQPLLNLARQRVRDGDGDGAYTMLETLFRAARDQTSTVIDGRTINLRQITRAPDDHAATCALVWRALLADGTRALAQAGRWAEAAACAATHRGVGVRLLDGRQTTILAHLHNSDVEKATTLVETSTTAEPWEHAVHSLLHVLCRRTAAADTRSDITAMLSTMLGLLKHAELPAVFRSRAGLTALDLANEHDDIELAPLETGLLTLAESDAYTARDALAQHSLHAKMTPRQRRHLTGLVHDAGLEAMTIPPPLHTELSTAVTMAKEQLATILDQDHARAALVIPTESPR